MKNFEVRATPTLPQEKLIRKFKRLADAFGVTKKYRQLKEFKKPSVKLKEKLAAADKRRKKLSKRMQDRGKI